ncbi:MAG: hypothetical protein H7066_19435, partial [Cytophagaceae bacterium]|nr:hypothetical protein [Gemmatimonadaceae bacterium]
MRCLHAIALAAVVTALGITAPVAHGQEDKAATAKRYKTLLEQHKGDFDYLLGDWRFTARNSEHGAFTGVWSAVRLATGGGAHVLDEYRVTSEQGETYFASSTLRVYNPAIDTWELVSVHETSGLQDRGTARRVGDEMRLEQTFGVTRGAPESWRIRYFDIRADAFRWAADRSLDGGKTWERNYMTLEARRIGP